MRIASTALAFAAGLALSGCNLVLPSADGRERAADTGGDATAITLGQKQPGEITTASGLNYVDGSRHQLYALTLDAGQPVALRLEGALAGTLSVFSGDALVASTAAGGGEGPTRLAFRAAGAGRYLVAVSGRGARAYGPYTLQAEALVPYDGKPLVGEGEIVDWLTTPRQDYTLQVARAGMYTVTLASTAFDTELAVRGPGVDAKDDDGGDGTNSRLRLHLQPGSYTLAASAVEGPTTSGDFQLAVGFAALPDGLVDRDGSVLRPGATVHGQLGSNGQRRFVLELADAATVTLDARSDDVDTVLHVTGPGGPFEDDDGGNGTDSRLSESLRAGRYEVRVSSLDDSQGLFQLDLQVD